MMSKFAKWEQTRKLGRQRFIWRYGVFLWGVSFGCLMAITSYLEGILTRHPSPLAVAIWALVVAGPLGGYVFGLLYWKIMETKYLEAQQADLAEQERKATLDTLVREVRELKEELKHAKEGKTPAGA